jgi:hypothetical protein
LPELKSINRGPVAFSLDSVTAYFGLGYASVVANQPGAYRNQVYRLEIAGTSAVPQVRILDARVVRTAQDTYHILGNTGPYRLEVYTLAGHLITSFRYLAPFHEFSLRAPSGTYVFSLQNNSGEALTELMFHQSQY